MELQEQVESEKITKDLINKKLKVVSDREIDHQSKLRVTEHQRYNK